MLRLVVGLVLMHVASGWKPVVGPTAYHHITNHHPVMGTQNTIVEGDGTARVSGGHSITYHGNIFPQQQSQHEDEPVSVVLNAGEPGGLDDGDLVEGRVLSGIADNKYLDHGFAALGVAADPGHCTLDKYALEHEGTIQYDQTIPKLEQFTLCAWMRFINHSGDHSIFTYSVDGEPREIQFWVANSKGSSYISLAVHGQSLFRLNYPLKLKKWHHACSSWNGKTGEWQLWVKAERVGRGFHNRIVGHVIRPHGVVYSGGPSITGQVPFGLHMEVTMVQLYKVALSAGKAHRDHKHHHVHHFNHEGPITSTPAPPPPPPPQPMVPANAILANGQINTRLRINYAGIQPQPGDPAAVTPIPGLLPIQQPTISTLFSRGQFSSGERLVAQQLFGARLKQGKAISSLPTSPAFVFPQPASPSSFATIQDSSNIQYIDGAEDELDGHIVFKRHDAPAKQAHPTKAIVKRQAATEKAFAKRALVSLTDGTVIDDRDIAANAYDFDGLAQFGAIAFQEALTRPKGSNIEDEIREHDREPAEGEVEAVLNLCSSCANEPFQGAIILAWKDAKITVDGGLHGHSLGGCGHF